jgi:signal transduction histidine kinase
MKNRNPERARSAVVLTAVLLIYGLAWQWPSPARGQQSVAPKRVLVLYWYNKEYLWNVEFDQSFKFRLDSAPPGSIEYYQEYLESNRFPGESQASLLRDYLRKKYADHPIDVVVATSDASLEFLIKDRSSLFPRAPIVFVATKYPTTAETTTEPGLTGIINIAAHRRTVDLALSLHPATEQVFVVSGTLEHDKRLERAARQELQGYEGRVQITYLTDLSSAQLIEKMNSLPKRSIVLYVWEQSKNEQGKLLESVDLFALIAPHTHVPIYGMLLPLVGRGAVGGYVNTGDAAGTKIAEVVLRIATGRRAVDIPVERAPAEPIFDWRELRHWGIRENELPRDSLIRFRELTLWDQYKWRILGIVVLFLVLLWVLYQLRLRQLAREFNAGLEGRVNERTRIARELHDSLLQGVQGLMFRLQAVRELLPGRPSEAIEALDIALERGDKAIAEGRDTVSDLRKFIDGENDIAKALTALGEELAAQSGNDSVPRVRVLLEGKRRELNPMLRDEIYRIAREALRNAFRHAKAQKIEAEITYGDSEFSLRVRDDGLGIDSEVANQGARAGHWGLPGMRERASSCGGNLEVWSEHGAGTEIELSVPAPIAYGRSEARRRFWFLRKKTEGTDGQQS